MPARRVVPREPTPARGGSFSGSLAGEVNLPTPQDADMNSAYMNYEDIEASTETKPLGTARVRRQYD